MHNQQNGCNTPIIDNHNNNKGVSSRRHNRLGSSLLGAARPGKKPPSPNPDAAAKGNRCQNATHGSRYDVLDQPGNESPAVRPDQGATAAATEIKNSLNLIKKSRSRIQRVAEISATAVSFHTSQRAEKEQTQKRTSAEINEGKQHKPTLSLRRSHKKLTKAASAIANNLRAGKGREWPARRR